MAFLYLSMVDFTLQYNDAHCRSQHTRLLKKIKAATRRNHMYHVCVYINCKLFQNNISIRWFKNPVLLLLPVLYVYRLFNIFTLKLRVCNSS